MNIDMWKKALAYEETLIDAMETALQGAMDAKPPSDLAKLFAQGWQDDLSRNRAYIAELKAASDADALEDALKMENQVLLDVLAKLPLDGACKSSLFDRVKASWQEEFEGEISLNDKALTQLR
jgi:hypothetical protein